MENPAHLTSLINDFEAKKNAGYFCIRQYDYIGLLFFGKHKSLFTLNT